MLSDSQLLFFCVVLTVLGTIGFVFLAAGSRPLRVEINSLSSEQVGLLVEVRGRASLAYNNSGGLGFLVCDNSCVLASASPSLRNALVESNFDFSLLAANKFAVVSGVLEEGRDGFVVRLLSVKSVDFQ